MRNYFKRKIWLAAILMFIITLGLSSAVFYYEFVLRENIKITRASADDNVSGWAWGSNIGWISFNCTEDSPQCLSSDYGVKIDLSTGHFSGYAWGSNIGWISFNETNPPDSYAFNVGCAAAGSCTAGDNCTACYNFDDQKVYGWAKILSLGSNGWIKFNDAAWSSGVTIDPANSEFSGWAWNANDDGTGAGWISFNCANDDSCGTSDYKTIGQVNRPPAVANMTAPNWNYLQAKTSALRANLNFDFVDSDSGSFGSAYQIIVRKADDSLVLDTGKCTAYDTPAADPVKCKIDVNPCLANGSSCQYPLTTELSYNTGYKWSVQVWDNYDTASLVASYSTNPDTDNNDGVVPTFTTYKHEFPKPVFTPFPANPSRGEEVRFNDASQTYLSAAPATAIPCTDINCAWFWSVPADATIDNATISTPTVIFNTVGTNIVTLRLVDKNDGYWAEITIPVEVNASLPGWKEVKP